MKKQNVQSEYAFALEKIGEALKKNKTAAIGIDGRCGSGKTTFAKLVAQTFPCNLIHMDDFYLPFSERKENWMKIPGGNMDFTRLRMEALEPLRSGSPAEYRPYNCKAGAFGETRLLSPKLPLVVEGSYSLHPDVRLPYGLTLFLTCDRAEQERRLKQREGAAFSMFYERWMPLEESYFQHFKVEERCHLRIDTAT